MATIPTATIIPGPKFMLTPKGVSDARGLFMLGNSDPYNSQVGCYAIEFRMSTDWVGSIGILGRNGVHKAGVDDIALLGPWSFRAFYLNNVAVDPSQMQVGANAIITATSSILVPAAGQTIGLGVSCSAGSCEMYYLPLLGQSAV